MRKSTLFACIVFVGITISCLDPDVGPIVIGEPGSFEEQLEFDIKLIDSILALDNIEVEIHESGIRYIVEAEGIGDSAKVTDDVTVIYEGRLLNGQVFDGNADGVSFALRSLIQAWQLTIPLMKKGGKITIYSPSGLCYGNSQVGNIPPNSSLVFDIELLEINPE